MKKKTRNLIGKILFWGGLVGITFFDALSIYAKSVFQYDSVYDFFTVLNLYGWNIFIFVCVMALLIGGLWGMKK